MVSISKRKRGQVATHVVLGLAVCVTLFPFYWSFVMATNTTADIYKYPPKLIPGTHLVENVRHVLQSLDFFGSLLNTVIVATATTALVLFFDSLAAFTFAKFKFPGRTFLFGLLLAIFMLPGQLSVITQYIIMTKIGWVGTLRALVVPAAANAFGIFWMRQYIGRAVSDDLLDASRIDGAGFFRQYRSVCLPVIRPGLAFLGIYTFIAAWNDYLWPLIVLNNPHRLTLQVALSQLNQNYGGTKSDYGMIMAGTLMSVLPLLIVFVIGARNFVSDLAEGAVKG